MKLALPNTHNFPPTPSKRLRHDFVARHIVVELAAPEFESAFRCIRKFAALMPVPKASIYENGELIAGENKIRFSKYSCVTPPTGDAMLAKQSHQPQLSVSIPACANSRHKG